MLPAGQKHAWKPAWLALLALVQPAIPAHWQVIVLTDRGLYARWLYRAIVAHHWHPFMRSNHPGTFHAGDRDHRQPLTTFAPRRGTGWAGTGVAFKGSESRLACSLAGQMAIRTPGASGPTSHPRPAPSDGMACGTGLNKIFARKSGGAGSGSIPR
jgi:hypothetical protein